MQGRDSVVALIALLAPGLHQQELHHVIYAQLELIILMLEVHLYQLALIVVQDPIHVQELTVAGLIVLRVIIYLEQQAVCLALQEHIIL